LKRREFKVLNSHDITEYKENYLKEVIAKLINISKENAKTINLRVDFMTMAQEYYQRAIITLVFYAVFMFIVIIKNLKFGGRAFFTHVFDLKSYFIHSDWLQIVFFALLILNTIFLLVILNRTKSQRKK
jgi:hypothetical protein